MDVASLYTNIPHADGLDVICNTISDTDISATNRQLAEFVLTHNYFRFGDRLYLQTRGTAMGSRMAPQYANLFMADLEQRFLQTQPLKPFLYLRYINDIFLIWTHGEESLKQFHRN